MNTDGTLNPKEKTLLIDESRHLLGLASSLVSIRSNEMTVSKIRDVLNDAYNRVDKLVILIDEIEIGKHSN